MYNKKWIYDELESLHEEKYRNGQFYLTLPFPYNDTKSRIRPSNIWTVLWDTGATILSQTSEILIPDF